MSITYQQSALIQQGAIALSIDEPKTIQEVVNEIDEKFPETMIRNKSLVIHKNGMRMLSADAADIIFPKDVITFVPGFAGGSAEGQSQGVKIATTLIQIAAIAGAVALAGAGLPPGALFLAQAGVAISGQLLVLGIRAIGRQDVAEIGSEDENQVGYNSITNGANQYRVDEPQNLILTSRDDGVPFYPPYDTNQYYTYELYKIDARPNTTVHKYADVAIIGAESTPTQNSTVTTESGDIVNVEIFPFTDPATQDYLYYDQNSEVFWTAKAGFQTSVTSISVAYIPNFFEGWETLQEAIDDTSWQFFTPTMVLVDDPSHPCDGSYVALYDLIATSEGATCYTPIPGAPSILIVPCYSVNIKTLKIYDKREFVSVIYNIGYGCLEYPSQRFGPKDFALMRYSNLWINDKTSINWPMFSQPALPNPAGVVVNKEFNTVEGRVFQTDAGELHNRQDTEQVITEVGPAIDVNALQIDGTYFLEADIEGVGYKNAASKYEGIERSIQATFFDNINGGAGMLESCNGVDPVGNVVMLNIQKAYRDTLFSDRSSAISKYQMDLSKTSPDDTLADFAFDLHWKRAKFYQTDINTNYLMINRLATKVSADDQKSGRADRFNLNARAKMWICDPDAGTWTWGYSGGLGTNPADVLMYVVLGGYENPSASGPGSFPGGFPNADANGWTTGKHPDNGMLRWGLGYDTDCIDYDAFKRWNRFCSDQKLYFDAVIEKRMTDFEALKVILATGRASLSFASGKLGMVWEDPNEPVSYLFNDSNIIKNSLKIETLADGFPDKIKVGFTNSQQNAEGSEDVVEAVMPFVNPANAKTEARINILGIPTRYNAQREANLLTAKNRYQRRVFTFQSRQGSLITRGCKIMFNHSHLRYGEGGRACQWKVSDEGFTKVKMNKEICVNIWDSASIMFPNGQFETVGVTIDGQWVCFDDPIPFENGPEHYNQCAENQFSTMPGTVGADFNFNLHIGQDCRYLRVTRVDYGDTDDCIATITALPDEPAIYAYEFHNLVGLNGEPAAPADIEDFQDCNKPIPKVLGAKAYSIGGDLWCFEYKLVEAMMAMASVSLDGAPVMPVTTSSGMTMYGEKFIYEIPENTDVKMIISPVGVGPVYNGVDPVEACLEFTT